MKIKIILCTSFIFVAAILICAIVPSTIQTSTPAPAYEFYGRHFVASYKNCDSEALQRIPFLMKVFEKAVQSSGATILKYDCIEFPGNGVTAYFVLSESHASIHTYPEHNSCFVDLFTCGYSCSHENFDRILESYLKPKDTDKHLYIRS